MFKLADTLPAIYPSRTLVTKATVGPVVWAETELGDTTVMAAFNRLEAWEFVKVALAILSDERRAELLDLLHGVPRADHDAAMLQSRTRADALAADLADRDTLAAMVDRLRPVADPRPAPPRPRGAKAARR